MSSRHSLIARVALNNSSRKLNGEHSYRCGRKHSHPSGARVFPVAQENQTIPPCWRTPLCSVAVRKGPQPPWHNLALFGNTGLPLGSSLIAASVMRDISVSAGPLIGLASPAPSMEGERLKAFHDRFRQQMPEQPSWSSACSVQAWLLRFCPCQFLPCVFRAAQSSRGLSIQMYGNFVKGHGVTSLKEWLIAPVMR